MQLYPLSERFFSIQGEGLHCGRAAYFIRLFGCNVRCPWCDSKYAWNGEPSESLPVSELAADAAQSGAKMAVITGGEPCMFGLAPLVEGLKSAGIAAHLETSATLPLDESEAAFDWVAASPKLFARAEPSVVARADEIKLTISEPSDMPRYDEILSFAKNARAVWLHPEWSRAGDRALLDFICRTVKSRGGIFRAGWQMHKNYFAR